MTGTLYDDNRKAVLREYAQAVKDGAWAKARSIRRANLDLASGFDELDASLAKRNKR